MSNAMWFNEGTGQFTNLAVAANEDGRLEVFTYESVGAGRVWHKWQTAPNNGWSKWEPFGVVEDYHYTNNYLYGHTDLFVGLSGDGHSCLRVVTQGGWSVSQTAMNSGWGTWDKVKSAGMPQQLLVTAMTRSIDGRLYVFGVDQGSLDVVFTEQDGVNGSWSNWRDFGHPTQLDASYAVRADDWTFRSRYARVGAANQAVGANQDGRIEIFAASRFQMWNKWQTNLAHQGEWMDWQPLGTPPPVIENLGDWTVIQNQDGRLEAFAVTKSEDGSLELWHAWQSTPNGGWRSGWHKRPGLQLSYLHTGVGTEPLKGSIRTARSADGRLMIFGVARNGGLYYHKQAAPNGGWETGWHPLGGEGITAFDVAQNADGRLEVFIVSGGSVYHRWQLAPDTDNWSTHENE